MYCCLVEGKSLSFYVLQAIGSLFLLISLQNKESFVCCVISVPCLWHVSDFAGFSRALNTQWLCRSAALPLSLLIFTTWLRAGSGSFVLLLLVSLWCQHCEKWLLYPVAETTVDLLPNLYRTLSWSCFWERYCAAEQQVQATFPSFINKNGTLYRFQNAIASSVFNCLFNKYSF